MPTYQYRCRACAGELEVFQKFTDDPLSTCPECGGALRKLFSPVGIVFKGSGFYATDSRKSARDGAKAAPTKSEPAAKTETTTSKTESAAKTAAPAKDSTAA